MRGEFVDLVTTSQDALKLSRFIDECFKKVSFLTEAETKEKDKDEKTEKAKKIKDIKGSKLTKEAAIEILRNRQLRDFFFTIFARPSAEYLGKVLKDKIKDTEKLEKGGYILYLLMKATGKEGGFFRMNTQVQAKQLLRSNNQYIRKGAELAYKHLRQQLGDEEWGSESEWKDAKEPDKKGKKEKKKSSEKKDDENWVAKGWEGRQKSGVPPMSSWAENPGKDNIVPKK